MAAGRVVAECPETGVGPKRLDFKTRLLTAVVVLANVLGNFSLSWGMKHQAAKLADSPLVYIQTIFSPWVLLGTTLLIVWLLARMTLLSWADLSYVLPVTSMAYVLVALVGRFVLHEAVSWAHWAGILLIMAGVSLVGSTNPNTAASRCPGAHT